jgi:hypothetical protein
VMCEHRYLMFGQSRIIDLPIACFYDIDGIYHVTLHHAYHAFQCAFGRGSIYRHDPGVAAQHDSWSLPVQSLIPTNEDRRRGTRSGRTGYPVKVFKS